MLLPLSLLLVLPAAVEAQLTFTTNNGAITITGYTGPAGTVIIPSTTNGYPVTSIAGTYSSYYSATNLTIPDTVTNIGDNAFYRCSYLMKITLGNGVRVIGTNAFYDCISLTSIRFPSTLTRIGDWAFCLCGMTNLTIPSSLTNIGSAAFATCHSLTAITADTNNPAFSSVAGVLFDKSQTTLVAYPGGITGSYAVPNGVTNIGSGSFYGCSLLCVTLPASVGSIGAWAFIGSSPSPTLLAVFFEGNPPNVSTSGFPFSGPTCVYYLPGTSGWGSFFGGTLALLWNPVIQTTNGSVGVRTNQFGFNITGTSNIPVVVEASTELGTHNWTPLQTNLLVNGLSYFSDPQWTNYPARIYRLRTQ